MDRESFKKMNDNERIAWVESKYTEGLTTSEIAKQYDIPKNTLGDTFRRNGYISNKKKRMYVKTEHVNNSFNHVSSENVVKSTVTKSKHENSKNMVSTNKHKKNRIMLELPTNIKMELGKMLTWYKTQQKKEEEREEIYSWMRKQMQLQETIVNIPQIEIRKDKLTGGIRTRSFTIYTDVLKQFSEFCKDKSYSKQDLLSMAIVEYMEKYK